MKLWKSTVILSVIISVIILVTTSFLAARLESRFSLPFSFNNGQIQPDRLALGKYGTTVSLLGMLFTLSISGILILYIVPGRVRCVADSFSVRLSQLLRLTLLGFLTEILVVAVGIGSALMIGTFPLTILLVGAVFITGLVGFVSLAYAVGRGMLRRANWLNNSPVLSLLLGLLILLALFPIPILGGVLFLAFTSLGLGATIVSHFGSGEPWNLNSLMEDVTNEKAI